MIYRIMYNTNSMNADTDYIEMAQLLGDAALPGEAAGGAREGDVQRRRSRTSTRSAPIAC